MITAISNFNENNAKNSISKQQFLNDATKRKSDYSKCSNQISFTANPLQLIRSEGKFVKAGEGFLGEGFSKLGRKITRIVEDAINSTKELVKKINAEKDLPFVEKPLIANAKSKEEVAKEVDAWNKAHPKAVKLNKPSGDGLSEKNWKEHWLQVKKDEEAAAAKKAKDAEEAKHHTHFTGKESLKEAIKENNPELVKQLESEKQNQLNKASHHPETESQHPESTVEYHEFDELDETEESIDEFLEQHMHDDEHPEPDEILD